MMIARIFLWKLGFELANLRKALGLGTTGQPQRYFAFGANVDAEILRRRAIEPRAGKDFAVSGYRLAFCHPGPFDGMGFASLQEAPGAVTFGKLYDLSPIDALRMDYFEAVPFLRRYRRRWLEQDGERFYFYESTMPCEGLKPTREYLDRIVTAARQAAIAPPEYLDALSAHTALEAHELRPTTRSYFLSPPSWPPWLHRLVLAADRRILSFYARHLRTRSLTEWLLRRR